eukprot:scaffold4498_cov119-Isochrysis_galbana.AAC.31
MPCRDRGRGSSGATSPWKAESRLHDPWRRGSVCRWSARKGGALRSGRACMRYALSPSRCSPSCSRGRHRNGAHHCSTTTWAGGDPCNRRSSSARARRRSDCRLHRHTPGRRIGERGVRDRSKVAGGCCRSAGQSSR